MTDAELDARLRAVRVPERDPAYWEKFPRGVLIEVRAGPRPQTGAGPIRLLPRLAWAGAVALVVVMGAWCVESPRACPLRGVVAAVESFGRFPEDLALLPEHLQAVLQPHRGLDTLVEDSP